MSTRTKKALILLALLWAAVQTSVLAGLWMRVSWMDEDVQALPAPAQDPRGIELEQPYYHSKAFVIDPDPTCKGLKLSDFLDDVVEAYR